MEEIDILLYWDSTDIQYCPRGGLQSPETLNIFTEM